MKILKDNRIIFISTNSASNASKSTNPKIYFYNINDDYDETNGERESPQTTCPISLVILNKYVPRGNLRQMIILYNFLCKECGLDINIPVRLSGFIFPFAYHILSKIGSTPNFDEADAYYLCQQLVKDCNLQIDIEFFNPESQDPILRKYSSRLLSFCFREEIVDVEQIRDELKKEVVLVKLKLKRVQKT